MHSVLILPQGRLILFCVVPAFPTVFFPFSLFLFLVLYFLPVGPVPYGVFIGDGGTRTLPESKGERNEAVLPF